MEGGRAVVALRLHQLREQIAAADRLRVRLESLARLLERAEVVSAEQFLPVIESFAMFDKDYTPEQLAELVKRSAADADRMRKVMAELRAEVRAERDKGTSPTDPKVEALAAKWAGIVNALTGGDPGLRASLQETSQAEPGVAGTDLSAIRSIIEDVQQTMESIRERGRQPPDSGTATPESGD